MPPAQIVGVFAKGASQPFLPAEPMSPQNRRLSFLVKFPAPVKAVKPVKPVKPAEPPKVEPAKPDEPTAKPGDTD